VSQLLRGIGDKRGLIQVRRRGGALLGLKPLSLFFFPFSIWSIHVYLAVSALSAAVRRFRLEIPLHFFAPISFLFPIPTTPASHMSPSLNIYRS
jgi:hypothetical protein